MQLRFIIKTKVCEKFKLKLEEGKNAFISNKRFGAFGRMQKNKA